MSGIPAREKTGDHGIAGSHRIDHHAAGRGAKPEFPHFIQQRGALPAHRHQNIARAALLQPAGIRFSLLRCADLRRKQFLKLMPVRLDEERMIRKRVRQQRTGCIHDKPQVSVLPRKLRQNIPVNSLRHRRRHTPGQDKGISVPHATKS